MQICPYLEYAFQIIGKKWNGLIIHYLSISPNQTAHFSNFKKDLPNITPRALSLKLTDLIELGLVEKRVDSGTPVTITYHLTEAGLELTASLEPIREWAKKFKSEMREIHE